MPQNLNFETDLSIINRMDWNTLSCLDKALSLAASLFNQNAFWNFVFRKYSESDFLIRCIPLDYADIAYYDTVCHHAGVKIERHSISRNLSFAAIQEAINSGKLCVVIINNKYRPGSKHFGVKDHPHFVLVTQMREGVCSILDEIVEKEFWKPENYKSGVEYSEQSIEANSLFSMTRNTNKFAQCLGFQVNCADALYYFSVQALEYEPVNNHINSILKNEISLMVNSAVPHIDFIDRELTFFYKSYIERYQGLNLSDTINMKELHKSDPLGIKEMTYFPYEWKLAKFHMAYFKSVMSCAPNIVNVKMKTNFGAESIYSEYSKLQMLLSRDIIKNNYSEFPHLADMFCKIYQAEISVLSAVLNVL